MTLLSAWGLDKSGHIWSFKVLWLLQMCRHSCQWVLSKKFKGSSVFLPFTGQANQLGSSLKLGNKPNSSSSWIQDIQFFILLYLRQEKAAPRGTPLYPILHPQLSNGTAAVSEPWQQNIDHRGIQKQHGEGRVKVWGCHAAGYIIPCRTQQVSLPLHRSWCLRNHHCPCWRHNS